MTTYAFLWRLYVQWSGIRPPKPSHLVLNPISSNHNRSDLIQTSLFVFVFTSTSRNYDKNDHFSFLNLLSLSQIKNLRKHLALCQPCVVSKLTDKTINKKASILPRYLWVMNGICIKSDRLKSDKAWSSLCGTVVNESMRLWVRSLTLLSGLRIQRCREMWCSLQMWLRSRVAVALA